MAVDNLAAFALAVLLIEMTPGPNMAFLALVSATEGRKYGFATVLGVTLGLLIIGLLAAFGVAAIVSESPFLFQLLRWGGIAYLLYLAWEGWRESGENSPQKVSQSKSGVLYFRHGLVVNLLNPKAAFFYITILPTFLRLPNPQLNDTVILTLVYIAIATVIHLLIISFAGLLNPYLVVPERNKMVRRMLSVALAAVAVWFGWSTHIA